MDHERSGGSGWWVEGLWGGWDGFDKVPHRRLVGKIRAHGIGGRVLTWIEKLVGRQETKSRD